MSDNNATTVPPDFPAGAVVLADMCLTHRKLLVGQAGYGPQDPWRALEIASQVALFQAMTADPRVQRDCGDDVTKIHALGCMACRKPDAFGELVEAAKTHDLGVIKALGERWVYDAARKQ